MVSARGGEPNTSGLAPAGGGGGRIRFVGDFSAFAGVIDARGGGARGVAGRGRPGTFTAESFPSLWTIKGGFALLHQNYVVQDFTLDTADTEVWMRPESARNGIQFVLDARALKIAAGASLSADGEGLRSQAGVGTGDVNGGGGGYGGTGGAGSAGSGGITYGSAGSPIVSGSHGAGTHGGGGGGVVAICAGTLDHAGVISADGESRANLEGAAGGSGGSVFVETTDLVGSGFFRARGGLKSQLNVAGARFPGSGGGGRVRVIVHGNGTAVGRCDAVPGSVGTGATSGTTRCD